MEICASLNCTKLPLFHICSLSVHLFLLLSSGDGRRKHPPPALTNESQKKEETAA